MVYLASFTKKNKDNVGNYTIIPRHPSHPPVIPNVRIGVILEPWKKTFFKEMWMGVHSHLLTWYDWMSRVERVINHNEPFIFGHLQRPHVTPCKTRNQPTFFNPFSSLKKEGTPDGICKTHPWGAKNDVSLDIQIRVRRCLNPKTSPEKAFKGSKHLLTRYLEDFGCLGYLVYPKSI